MIWTFGILLASTSAAAPTHQCGVDTALSLKLSFDQFDQDMEGGWRAVASRGKNCLLPAANLIAAYRAKHPRNRSLLNWHEGQLRATAGDYRAAIPLMKASRHAPTLGGFQDGWNPYVDATIAFLRGDRQKLLKASAELKATPRPPADAYPPDQPWPFNVDVAQGLINCFGKPYAVAYQTKCRSMPK